MRRAAQDGPMRRAAQLWEGDSSSSSSAHLPATVKIVQTQIASEMFDFTVQEWLSASMRSPAIIVSVRLIVTTIYVISLRSRPMSHGT